MINDLLDKINKLYKKQITEGLTAEEKQEQTELRKAYLKVFRENFKAQLDTIKVVDSDEKVKTVKDLKH